MPPIHSSLAANILRLNICRGDVCSIVRCEPVPYFLVWPILFCVEACTRCTCQVPESAGGWQVQIQCVLAAAWLPWSLSSEASLYTKLVCVSKLSSGEKTRRYRKKTTWKNRQEIFLLCEVKTFFIYPPWSVLRIEGRSESFFLKHNIRIVFCYKISQKNLEYLKKKKKLIIYIYISGRPHSVHS